MEERIMNQHDWETVESTHISMKCVHCGQLIDVEDTEDWNLRIFANCPNKYYN